MNCKKFPDAGFTFYCELSASFIVNNNINYAV